MDAEIESGLNLEEFFLKYTVMKRELKQMTGMLEVKDASIRQLSVENLGLKNKLELFHEKSNARKNAYIASIENFDKVKSLIQKFEIDKQNHEEIVEKLNHRIQELQAKATMTQECPPGSQISEEFHALIQQSQQREALFYREVKGRDTEIFRNRHSIASLQNEARYYRHSCEVAQECLETARHQIESAHLVIHGLEKVIDELKQANVALKFNSGLSSLKEETEVNQTLGAESTASDDIIALRIEKLAQDLAGIRASIKNDNVSSISPSTH